MIEVPLCEAATVATVTFSFPRPESGLMSS